MFGPYLVVVVLSKTLQQRFFKNLFPGTTCAPVLNWRQSHQRLDGIQKNFTSFRGNVRVDLP